MSFLDDLPDIIGDALGDDFRDATLTQDGAPTGPAYNPTPGTPQSYACKAIFDEWGAYSMASGLVQATDRKVLILATSLAITPKGGDRITIDGQTLTIWSGGEGQPGVTTDPAKAVWTIRCRT